MQKSNDRNQRDKALQLEALTKATGKREQADERQIRAAHSAKHAGATWAEIAAAASKGSAAAAASYFGDSRADRAAKQAAARERAARRI